MSKIPNVCNPCHTDKSQIKMFSAENYMEPGSLPNELTGLTVIEQQLIARISPSINVHMLKHEGTASSGQCVTFPQNVNRGIKHDFPFINIRKVPREEWKTSPSISNLPERPCEC